MVILQLFHKGSNGICAFHCVCQLPAGQLLPRRGDDGAGGVYFPDHIRRQLQLLRGDAGGTGEDNGIGRGDLIVIKFAKVSHIAFDLGGIGNGDFIGDLHALHLFHSRHHIGKLAHTGGLDDDAVGRIIGQHLLHRLTEITHKRATDTAGIHLPDLYAGFLQKAAVNADLAKFVLDQHDLLPGIKFPEHFLNQCRFAGA